jgi:hypothetical protein
MGHGPINESQSNVSFVDEVFYWCIVMCHIQQVIKVDELVMVQIMGTMEDERTFNIWLLWRQTLQ